MSDSIDPVGNVADQKSSQTLGSGDTMADATQSLATGPAAGPTASQTFGSGAAQDYDRGEQGGEPAEDVAATSAPIPTETDDGGAAASDVSYPAQASITNPSAGEYSVSGDAEIKGVTRTDPTESGNS
jgi:hypothetical protein